jgi:hypothetical protein
VNHPAPPLTVPTDWLEQAGCTYGGYDWDCTPDGLVGALGCEKISVVDLLGGLSPADPLVECFNYTGEPPDRTKFEEEGCMMLVLTSHLLFKDNAYQLVSGADELRPLFAPVESADEALSYALAATNLYARYGQEIDPDRQYLVDEVEDTHVDETPEGYLVHLFSPPRPACGCAIHTIDAVDVLVTRDGQVTETDSQSIYEFGACID